MFLPLSAPHGCKQGSAVKVTLCHVVRFASFEVEGMNNRSTSAGQKTDLQMALDLIDEHLGQFYLITILRNCQPENHGYPILRPRWYAAWA